MAASIAISRASCCRMFVFCIPAGTHTDYRSRLRHRDLEQLLCEMNGVSVVSAYKFFELDAVAVFRDLA
jgi:hypothetical protein